MPICLTALMSILKEIKSTLLHFFKRFWHSPLLIGYCVIGTIATYILFNYWGLLTEAVNLLVLIAFAVLIRMMTSKRPAAKLPIHRPKIELIVGILFSVLLVFVIFLIYNLTSIPGLQPLTTSIKNNIETFVNSLGEYGLPAWLTDKLYNAIICLLIQILPTSLLFIFFGYKIREIGLRSNYWLLTAILLGCCILMGPLCNQTILLYQQPLFMTLLLFPVDFLINGFPEELFIRGFLLPRFETIFKNPINALVITSLIFNSLHIPSAIANGDSASYAILNALTIYFPSGLLWGYLYQRTRSVLPGALFHTSFLVLGAYFFRF
ncbi:MAG: CPBP family intramembrane metalloprotease [Clostridia bacterium]|nr:CPBP family intramembrane metalloprotease [Clostridia bacterium]